MMRRTTRLAVALSALAAVAACGTGSGGLAGPQPGSSAVPVPFEACPASGPSAAPAPAGALPDVALPCFVGGQPVSLARLGRPAVVNFWASSCGPCRTELPQLQRFADATRGRLVVIGVVTADRYDAAASAGTAFGVSFPAVFDPEHRLLSALGRNVLPVTLFLDAEGVVRHTDVSGALKQSTLDDLAQRYLGVGR